MFLGARLQPAKVSFVNSAPLGANSLLHYQQPLLHLAETLHTVHLFLEVVVAKGGIGEGAADAVLAEASGEDAHVEEDVLHGRMDEAVAFQFDDYAVADVSARVDVVVMKPQAKVDGEAFGHTMVDEGDAVEEVLDVRMQLIDGVPRLLDQELTSLVALEYALETGHLDALLLRSSVVVFVLDLKESDACLLVGAYTDLLSHLAPRLVHIVHAMVVSVKVDGVITRCGLAVEHLDVVLRGCSQKQGLELHQRDDELRVDTVHQLHCTHLFERDGLIGRKYFVDLLKDRLSGFGHCND